MGIQGLLPQLKSIMLPIGVEELRGQSVAVDTYSWLHKGALACAKELCKGLPTSKHIDYCMFRVNLLRHHGVKPILIFDGGFLPIKIEQENKRSRSRKENLERAMEHEINGNSTAAFLCYQKAVDISPSIAFELIEVLKKENVDFIVAPYEADAQMTFLSINKIVAAVITEDSDLIPFGCSRIIFKMDKFGQGVEYQSSKLGRNQELDFTGFSNQMLLEMCILSGCDYLQSLPGMGLKRAHALIKRLKSYEKVIKHLRYSAVSVPPLYEEAFKKAILAFQHQRVYDPIKQDIVHLSDLPPDTSADLDFLGPSLPRDIAKGIAEGVIDPLTKMEFQAKEACSTELLNRCYSIKEHAPATGRKRLELPVQKNVLTNYFCLASIEAKRKFRAPKFITRESVIIDSSPSSENNDSESPCSGEDFNDVISPDSPKNTNKIEEKLSHGNDRLSKVLASLDAKRRFRAPMFRMKEVAIENSPSPNSKNSQLESPGSAEDATCVIKCQQSSPPSLGKFAYVPNSDNSPANEAKVDDNLLVDSSKIKSFPIDNNDGSLESFSLMEPMVKISQPLISSHKEYLSNNMVNAEWNMNKKVGAKSSYFKHKLVDADSSPSQNVDTVIKQKTNHVSNGDLLDAGASLEDMSAKSTIRKRKQNDVHDKELGALSSKNARKSSLNLEEEPAGSQLENSHNQRETMQPEGKFGCNITHLTSYNGIAEKSMEKFVALISSFRYTSSGSRASSLRASGLRAPLKDVLNTRTVRSSANISKFSYDPARENS